MVSRRAIGALAALLAASAIAGCGGPPPVPRDWAQTAGLEGDRVARIRARSDVATRLRASLELVWEDPETGEREGCSAFLSYDRGEGLRVLARSVAFVTVFELVADREHAWLDVPREGLTVSGDRDDPNWRGLPASPDAFLIALFADPWAGRESPDAYRSEGADVLEGDGWTLRLDPVTGLPATYRTDELEVTWGDWALRRGTPWPHEAEIRVGGDGLLRARLGRLILDRAGSPGQFEFETPQDREVLTPAQARERWKRAQEAP